MLPDVPLTSIGLAHLQQLLDGEVRESRRLDYKATLALDMREQRVEFLRDVVAMANADGGTILFGVQEGGGEEQGIAIGLPGIEVNPDATSNLIDSLTRDNIDERLTVLQHDVEVSPGKRVWLVRVPASPLAPHMIANFRTAPPRFYVRSNTSNEPMTARQIKEAALRHGAAVERAAGRINERVAALSARAKGRIQSDGSEASLDQAIFHLVPLFPHSEGWNYANPTVGRRLMDVPPFGVWDETFGEIRFTQYGAFREYYDQAHTGFLRDGSLEGQEYDVVGVRREGSTQKVLVGSDLLDSVDWLFGEAEKLGSEGMFPTPVLAQLHLLNVDGSYLQETRRWATIRGRSALVETTVASEAFVITEWSEKNRVLRNILNHVWQAWGIAFCPLFYDDGERMHFNPEGYLLRRPGET